MAPNINGHLEGLLQIPSTKLNLEFDCFLLVGRLVGFSLCKCTSFPTGCSRAQYPFSAACDLKTSGKKTKEACDSKSGAV